MILCVCANPALDITYHVPLAGVGASHSVSRVSRRAGGKATNVARLLHSLDHPVHLLAPLGGPVAAEFTADLTAAGIGVTAVPIADATRSTVGLADGTIFNEAGPMLTEAEWADFTEQFAKLVVDTSVVVLAGSVPRGPVGYGSLIELAREVGARSILDTSGPALRSALTAGPDVVAPNLGEARAALGLELLSPLTAADQLRAAGAGAAVVSGGANGLLIGAADGTWTAEPPFLVEGNPTGAGDAVTAAVAAGLAHDAPWLTVLADAVALAAGAVAAEVAGDFIPAVRHDARRLVTGRRVD